jgi:hypothetical protein
LPSRDATSRWQGNPLHGKGAVSLDGFEISGIAIVWRAELDGVDAARFRELATVVEQTCRSPRPWPVSRSPSTLPRPRERRPPAPRAETPGGPRVEKQRGRPATNMTDVRDTLEVVARLGFGTMRLVGPRILGTAHGPG